MHTLTYEEKLKTLGLLMEKNPPSEIQIDDFWKGYEEFCNEKKDN